MPNDEHGDITARDYTSIVKHVGRLFTAGDLSLSGIGGIQLPAAGMALATGVPFGIVLWVVTGLILGGPAWFPMLLGFVVCIAVYLVLSRDSEDKERIESRLLTWGSAKVKQPTTLSGQSKDKHPTKLRWVVILWRFDDGHTTVGIPKQTVCKYNPKPYESGAWSVADDRDAHDDWYEQLSKLAPIPKEFTK